MAISRKTQKERVKQGKIFAGLTPGQIGALIVAMIINVIIWNLLGRVRNSTKILVVVIITAAIMLLAMAKPYGMSCWHYIRTYARDHIFSKKVRSAKTEASTMSQPQNVKKDRNHKLYD